MFLWFFFLFFILSVHVVLLLFILFFWWNEMKSEWLFDMEWNRVFSCATRRVGWGKFGCIFSQVENRFFVCFRCKRTMAWICIGDTFLSLPFFFTIEIIISFFFVLIVSLMGFQDEKHHNALVGCHLIFVKAMT